MAKESTIEFVDSIKKVEPIDSGYRILFQKYAGVYYLKRDNSRFTEWEEIILGAKDSEKKVTVLALSSSLHIVGLVLQ